MSGWDEKHNHQHFRSCDRAVLLWPRALHVLQRYRCGGVLSDRIGMELRNVWIDLGSGPLFSL